MKSYEVTEFFLERALSCNKRDDTDGCANYLSVLREIVDSSIDDDFGINPNQLKNIIHIYHSGFLDRPEAVFHLEAILTRIRLYVVPAAPHPDDVAVSLFAMAMSNKMRECREKGRRGWGDTSNVPGSRLAELLVDHLQKSNPGNYVDLANFCMMLQQRGEHPGLIVEALERRDLLLRKVM